MVWQGVGGLLGFCLGIGLGAFGGGLACWGVGVHPLPSPLPLGRGDLVGVTGRVVGFLFGFWVGGVHPLPCPLPLGRGDFASGVWGFALGLCLWGEGILLGLLGLLGLLVGLRRGLLVVRCSRIGLPGSLWIPAIWCVGRLGLAVAGGVRRRVLL